ncbi:MAG: retroviral-like aspartic protease family protein [Deltaproteobacteria bacterium]|nr:retroviral-like aspartic protease family protein [Deltaproteobacteria bacterium]
MPFVKKYNDTPTKFDPPAPVLEIFLSSPGLAASVPTPVEALIDSGADITVIPGKFVDQLQLKLVDQLPALGYEGVQSEKLADVYSVKVFVRDVGDYVIRVISSDYDYALIGRDIINSWDLFLRGKTGIFDIS